MKKIKKNTNASIVSNILINHYTDGGQFGLGSEIGLFFGLIVKIPYNAPMKLTLKDVLENFPGLGCVVVAPSNKVFGFKSSTIKLSKDKAQWDFHHLEDGKINICRLELVDYSGDWRDSLTTR
jgi:hypothetical protein